MADSAGGFGSDIAGSFFSRENLLRKDGDFSEVCYQFQVSENSRQGEVPGELQNSLAGEISGCYGELLRLVL